MENVQLARKVKALEAQQDLMRDEVDAVRQFNAKILAFRAQIQLTLPGRLG